jgi:hypothetical protein
MRALKHVMNQRGILPRRLEAIDTAYRRIESEAYRRCWIHVRPRDEAREECRRLAARAEAGEYLPLLGVPFGVKDKSMCRACRRRPPIRPSAICRSVLHAVSNG